NMILTDSATTTPEGSVVVVSSTRKGTPVSPKSLPAVISVIAASSPRRSASSLRIELSVAPRRTSGAVDTLGRGQESPAPRAGSGGWQPLQERRRLARAERSRLSGQLVPLAAVLLGCGEMGGAAVLVRGDAEQAPFAHGRDALDRA